MAKIMAFSPLVLVLALTLPQIQSFPADDKASTPTPNFGNLKYTFGSKDEIPPAFFESPPLATANSNNTVTSTPASNSVQKVYQACQDGSGGMCVDAGSCPSNLKPDTNNPGACSSGQECCYGPPAGDKSCKSRGGECVPKQQCGRAPTYAEAQDCDKKNNQVCCIYT